MTNRAMLERGAIEFNTEILNAETVEQITAALPVELKIELP